METQERSRAWTTPRWAGNCLQRAAFRVKTPSPAIPSVNSSLPPGGASAGAWNYWEPKSGRSGWRFPALFFSRNVRDQPCRPLCFKSRTVCLLRGSPLTSLQFALTFWLQLVLRYIVPCPLAEFQIPLNLGSPPLTSLCLPPAASNGPSAPKLRQERGPSLCFHIPANILTATHEKPCARTTKLSHSWIPDPQELWDNKCLCCKLLTTRYTKILKRNTKQRYCKENQQ